MLLSVQKQVKEFKETNGYSCHGIDAYIKDGLVEIKEATNAGKTAGRILAKDAIVGKVYLAKTYFNSKRIIYQPVIVESQDVEKSYTNLINLDGSPRRGVPSNSEFKTNLQSWFNTEIQKTEATIENSQTYLKTLILNMVKYV